MTNSTLRAIGNRIGLITCAVNSNQALVGLVASMFLWRVLAALLGLARTESALLCEAARAPFLFASLCCALLLFRNLVISRVVLPSTIVSKSNSAEMERKWQEAHEAATKDSGGFERITLETDSPGVTIDCALWSNPLASTLPASSQRWIMWLNANGVAYEEIMTSARCSIATPCNAHLLCVNYRGVSRSTGHPIAAADLVADGCTAVRYLLGERGASEANVCIFGHSMGGGVGALVRRSFPAGPLVLDRTFSRLSQVVPGHVRGALAVGMGLALGVLAAIVVEMFSLTLETLAWPSFLVVAGLWSLALWLLLRPFGVKIGQALLKRVIDPQTGNALTLGLACAPSALVVLLAAVGPQLNELWTIAALPLHAAQFVWIGALVGLLAGASGVLTRLAGFMIIALGWEVSTIDGWAAAAAARLVLFHRLDEMIHLADAALVTALDAEVGVHTDSRSHVFEMSGRTSAPVGFPYCHMYSPEEDPRWDELCRLLLRIWP